MPSETKTPRVAECVDYDDETGKRVPGTRVKATSNASATRPELTRDRTSSKSKPHGDNTPPPSPHHHSRTKSSAKSPKESRKVVVEDDKKVKEERRRSGTVEKSNGSKRRSSSRPPSARDNFPKVRDEPSYFGVQPQTTPITLPSRPRASTSQSYGGSGRPLSYSGTPHPGYPTGAGPPLSNSAFYNVPTSVPTAPFGTSYPPPAGYQYAVVSQTKDYFAPQPRTLADRFVDPVHRASSAYGMRDGPRVQKAIDDVPYNYDDGYMSAAEQTTSIRTRRGSIREPLRPAFSEASRSSHTVSSKDEDRERMPPPPRPILRKGITEYTRDSSPAAVTLKYADSRPEYRDDHPRRALTRNSVSYDLGRSTEQFRLETANNGRRRQSYYGQSASTGSSGASGYEDKLNAAKGYQQEVTGEPVALTAENIKKQQRRQAGSTHSTKSSGSRSREESEYKYRSSATTRTTRSGSGADQNDENVTIKLIGSAKIVVGGAHLEIGKDGGEVQIKRQTSIRNGSEKSNSEYGEKESKYGERESRGLLPRRILDEDRRERRSRSRVDALRPELRSRMSSTNRTSQSYDRIRDTYANSHAQYYQPESVYQNGGWV